MSKRLTITNSFNNSVNASILTKNSGERDFNE